MTYQLIFAAIWTAFISMILLGALNIVFSLPKVLYAALAILVLYLLYYVQH